MTASEELALLEEKYQEWIEAGCPSSYTLKDGRSVSKPYFEKITARIDQLRAIVARSSSSSGTCPVAKFRRHD